MIPENGTRQEFKQWVLNDLWAWTCSDGHQIIPEFEWVRKNEKPPKTYHGLLLWHCNLCKHRWWGLQAELRIERGHRIRLKRRIQALRAGRTARVDVR